MDYIAAGLFAIIEVFILVAFKERTVTQLMFLTWAVGFGASSQSLLLFGLVLFLVRIFQFFRG